MVVSGVWMCVVVVVVLAAICFCMCVMNLVADDDKSTICDKTMT